MSAQVKSCRARHSPDTSINPSAQTHLWTILCQWSSVESNGHLRGLVANLVVLAVLSQGTLAPLSHAELRGEVGGEGQLVLALVGGKVADLVTPAVRGCLTFSCCLGLVGKLSYSIQGCLCFIGYLSYLMNFISHRWNIDDLIGGFFYKIRSTSWALLAGKFPVECKKWISV